MGLENPRLEDGLTIDLAQEKDFALGQLSVIPSAREVIREGIGETLEPRVMQVLVALARAEGAVVSRDELIRHCWEGRVVGEDSINRVIWRLRKLAEGDGPPPYVIETIPRVGYRLKTERFAPALASPVERLGIRPQDFGLWRVAIVSLATAAVMLAVWAFWPREGGDRSLSPILARDGQPLFLPDGSMLAYLPGAGGPQAVPRTPGGARPAAASGSAAAPSWSPDGKKLAYVAKEPDGSCNIMVVVLKDGKARKAGRCTSAETSSLAWQAGTPFLYFADKADGAGNAIFRLDLRSGKTQRMTGSNKRQSDNWP